VIFNTVTETQSGMSADVSCSLMAVAAMPIEQLTGLKHAAVLFFHQMIDQNTRNATKYDKKEPAV